MSSNGERTHTSDLDEHREDRLLQREAEVFGGELAALNGGRAAFLDEREETREGHVHSFHDVRQLEVLLASALEM